MPNFCRYFSDIYFISVIVSYFTKRHLRYSSETPTFHQNYLAMRNITEVTYNKPIAV
jgi:hypothetical protein